MTLAARTKSEIEQAAATIRARGDQAETLVLDVTDIDAVRKAIAQAAPFQILINNAGMNRPAYLPDVTIEDFDAIFALNVRAAFFMAHAVALRLIAAKLPGSIINVSSQMVMPPRAASLLRVEACGGRVHQGDGDRARATQYSRQQPGPDFSGDADDAAVF